MEKAEIGLIGGTGFYNFFEGKTKEIKMTTEFGSTSDKITIGEVFGKKVAFLPRHGKKHQFPPHKIPFRANISALKKIGVKQIIAPCAVGSLKTNLKPGDFIICDQFIDRTKKRQDTFFNGPKIAHIGTASPYCKQLRKVAIKEAKKLRIAARPKGTVVVIEGPRFSTLAESLWFSKMGWDVVNMTQYPEVVLSAELGICYLNISLITDYDVGVYSKKKIEPASIEEILKTFKLNTKKLKKLILAIIKNIPEKRSCDCKTRAERAFL